MNTEKVFNSQEQAFMLKIGIKNLSIGRRNKAAITGQEKRAVKKTN
jgi:hypothetical protein